MKRQIIDTPVRWIIVDDGAEPQKAPKIGGWEIVVLRPQPFWREGQNTQCRNLRVGLEFVDKSKPLLFIEDDEWYAPGYLHAQAALLKSYPMTGQRQSFKYNIRLMRYKIQSHPYACSLCTTGMIGDAITHFKHVIAKSPKLPDMAIWPRYRKSGYRYDGIMVAGIKCMPGRAGIDSGHEPNMRGIDDPDGATLKRWIGNDAKRYLKYSDRVKP